MIKKYQKITEEIIIKEIDSHEFIEKDDKFFISECIYWHIEDNNLECKINYENHYNQLKNNDYMYNTNF